MKKVLLGIFSFIVIFAFSLLLNLNINTKASTISTTDEIVLEEGVSIRTAGTPGIKFQAHMIEAAQSYDAYGFVVAYGKASPVELVIDATINNRKVKTLEFNSLSEDKVFVVTLIGITKENYPEDYTVRAYVKSGTDYIYSENVVYRNMYDVAEKIVAEDPELGTTGVIKDVLDAYNKVTYSNNGGQIAYQTREEMVADFIADFKTVTGVEISSSSTKAGTSADQEKFWYTEEMFVKWSWMIEYLLDTTVEGKNGQHAEQAAQYNSILARTIADVDGSNDDYKYWAPVRDIQGFLFGTANVWYTSSGLIDWSIDEYKNGFWEYLPDETAVIFEGSKEAEPIYASREEMVNDLLADMSTAAGHTITASTIKGGSSDGSSSTAGFRKAQLVKFLANDQLFNKWSWLLTYLKSISTSEGAITIYNEALTTRTIDSLQGTTGLWYYITRDLYNFVNKTNEVFMFGAGLIDFTNEELANGYTTPSTNVTTAYVLETPVKTGYKFGGWYDNAECSGTALTSISDSKTVYAKWEAVSEATVTLDSNNGMWDANTILENSTDLKETKLTRYLTYNSNGYEASLYTGKILAWWSYLGLKETAAKNVYEIVAYGAAGGTSLAHSYDYVIIWHGNLTDTTAKDTLDSLKSSTYVGKYIVFEDVPTSSSSACTITVNVVDSTDVTKTINSTYQYTDTLPEPVRAGYKFDGWYDNSDNKYEKVSELANVAPITLKAKWSFENHIIGSFEENSWVLVDETIQLYAEYAIELDDTLVWSSATPDIATVDQNGVVTGVSEGLATITVSHPIHTSFTFTFYVTVLSSLPTGIEQLIVESNNANIFVREGLSIGGVYNADIYGSINKLLYNKPLKIDTTYLAAGNNMGTYNTNEVATNGLEFITVHYTGNMASGADSDNNASYFANSSDVSIHYVTGNEGSTYKSTVFQTLDHAHGAYHAGDSSARDVSGAFKWTATGVAYDNCDLLEVKFSASNDFYFEINGKKTSIPLPTPYNYRKNTSSAYRNTDHIYNSDGTITSQSDYTGTQFSNRTPESFFNDQGFPIKVVNGEYYMGTTWWSYRQVHEGRICGSGGNRNSIGIESCVNQGSDLWYTWQVTAQLVAKLLTDNNLDISRVKGHHFFDGKDCPQPMLENDLEIWWEFIDLVIAEKELYEKYNNYTISCVSNSEYVASTGRINSLPAYTECITYTVTYTIGSTTKSITLSSIIPGSVA